MFGLLTLSKKILKKTIYRVTGENLSNTYTIDLLMDTFKAQSCGEYSHRANISKSDLGYGWIHYSLIRMLKPRKILCIGSRHGFLPAILAQACKDNKKGCVDFVDAGYGKDDPNNWTGVGYWKTKEGKNIFKKFNLNEWINLHIMTTKEFAKKNRSIFGYVYIDGDHSYAGVQYDYQTFWPRLKKNGFMAFHDINVVHKKSEGVYGVYKLWKEISNNKSIEFPFSGSGLGIIQKI